MSSSLISLSFKDREEDSVCSPGYSRAPRGIRVSSGTQERGRKNETGKRIHRKRERELERDKRKTLESKLRGMFRAAQKKSESNF